MLDYASSFYDNIEKTIKESTLGKIYTLHIKLVFLATAILIFPTLVMYAIASNVKTVEQEVPSILYKVGIAGQHVAKYLIINIAIVAAFSLLIFVIGIIIYTFKYTKQNILEEISVNKVKLFQNTKKKVINSNWKEIHYNSSLILQKVYDIDFNQSSTDASNIEEKIKHPSIIDSSYYRSEHKLQLFSQTENNKDCWFVRHYSVRDIHEGYLQFFQWMDEYQDNDISSDIVNIFTQLNEMICKFIKETPSLIRTDDFVEAMNKLIDKHHARCKNIVEKYEEKREQLKEQEEKRKQKEKELKLKLEKDKLQAIISKIENEYEG